MSTKTVELKSGQGIGWIRLNRPEVKNALSARAFQDIHEAIEAFDKDDSVAVIVLVGNGGVFSAGRDFRDTDVPPDFERRRTLAFEAVEYCSKPTIAAVAGYAITGGMTLALACDIVVAAQSAVFQDTHAHLGVITLRASRLYEVLGPLRTKELLFTSRRVSATDALAMGLVNQVVPDEALEEAASAMAAQIVRHDAVTLRAIKAVVNDVIRRDQRLVLELEELAKRRFQDGRSEHASIALRAKNKEG